MSKEAVKASAQPPYSVTAPKTTEQAFVEGQKVIEAAFNKTPSEFCRQQGEQQTLSGKDHPDYGSRPYRRLDRTGPYGRAGYGAENQMVEHFGVESFLNADFLQQAIELAEIVRGFEIFGQFVTQSLQLQSPLLLVRCRAPR